MDAHLAIQRKTPYVIPCNYTTQIFWHGLSQKMLFVMTRTFLLWHCKTGVDNATPYHKPAVHMGAFACPTCKLGSGKGFGRDNYEYRLSHTAPRVACNQASVLFGQNVVMENANRYDATRVTWLRTVQDSWTCSWGETGCTLSNQARLVWDRPEKCHVCQHNDECTEA